MWIRLLIGLHIFLVLLSCCVATPGRARRVPVTASAADADDAMEAETVDESEITDSDAENKLNPDEYEDDTTEFEQSEVAANDSQAEARDNTCSIYTLLFIFALVLYISILVI